MTAAASLVSVVIPAFNAERYLSAAVASVNGQRHGDHEVIVVDDGSTDGTREVAAAMAGVVCVHQPRAGAAAARNTGVQVARGEWLAFLDADDCWTKDKTACQMAHLADSGVDMVFGHADEFYSEEVGPTAGLAAASTGVAARCAGTMLIAREAFLRAGEFPTSWRVGEFIDWYLRATEAGLTAGMVPDVVLHRRLHPHNGGRSAGDSRQEYLRIIKQALDRRRGMV